MSSIKEKLQTIERKFKIGDIAVNGEPFWPFFRSLAYANLLQGLLLVYPKNFAAALRKARNATFHISRWSRRYDYIVFSNELERKQHGSYYIDKLAEGLIKKLGYDKTLYIEQVSQKHLKDALYGDKKVVSMDLLLVISALYKKIVKPGRKAAIEGEATWLQIANHLNMPVDFRDSLDTFLSKVGVLEFVFKQIQPKKIFITDYGNLPVIYAAKRKGIQVIELQHGLIGFGHPYYHPAVKLSTPFVPDFLLVFGENDLKGLAHGNYTAPVNTIPIGNFYLHLLKSAPLNPEIQSLTAGYRYSFGVPTDFTSFEYIFSFVCSVAKDFSDCLFLVVPRLTSSNELPNGTPTNIKLVNSYSYQEVIRHCDFNLSTNSTCCLEALALGAMNILLDEDGLASEYFGNILTNNKTVFVKSKDDFKNQLSNIELFPRAEVMNSNTANYMSNYDQQLDHAIDLINNNFEVQ